MKNKQKTQINFLFPKHQIKKSNKYRLSLLIITLGIFLLPQIGYFSSITPEKIIELTNSERSSAGLKNLTNNQLLTQAAYLKGQAIFETQTFQHKIGEKKFSSWIRSTGYNYNLVGENLAIDFMTSEGVLDAWVKSPSHKNNLLNQNFNEIGVAVIEGNFQGQNSIVVVQIFGAQTVVAPVQNTINNKQINFNLLNNQANQINSNYSTPIIYISNEPVRDYQQYNYIFINFLNIFYVFRFVPIAISFISLLGLIYICILRLFKLGNFKTINGLKRL